MKIQLKIPKINMYEFSLLFFMFGVVALENGTIPMKLIKAIFVGVALLHKASNLKLHKNVYLRWLLIFTLFSSLSLIWSYDREATISAISTSILNLLCVWAFIELLGDDKDLRKKRLIRLMYAIPLFTVLYYIRLFVTYGSIVFGGVRNLEGVADAVHNSLGMYAGVSISLIAYFIGIQKNKSMYLKIMVIFNAIILVLSGSRKSVFYAVIPIMVMFIMKCKNPKKVIRNLLGSIFALIIIIMLVMNVPVLYNLMGEGIQSMISGIMGETTDASTVGRMRLIRWGIEQFRNHAPLGIGLEGFRSLHVALDGRPMIADNNYVELLVDLGLVGTFLYYSFFVVFIAKCVKELKNKYLRENTILVFGALVSILICDFGCCSYKNLFLLIYTGIIWEFMKVNSQLSVLIADKTHRR